jgi:predicted O-methyltransferase YrrM
MNLLKLVEKYKNDLLVLNFHGLNKKSIPGYVKGSIRTCEAQTLYSIIRENKYENIIDIGTGPGFSALYFAQALRDERIDGMVSTFDITPKPDAVTLIKKFELSSFVDFVLGDSKEQIPLKMKDQTFDFVLIDGEHSYLQTKADLECVIQQVRPGGCIAFHDIYPRPKDSPGSRNVVDEIDPKLGEVVFFGEEIFDFFNYEEDVQDYIRMSQKWAHHGYSYVDQGANAKELMAVFFKS